MVEVRGVTLPVIALRIDPKAGVEEVKEAVRKKIKGNLFKGGFFLIENAHELSPEVLSEVESFLKDLNVKHINRFKEPKEKKEKVSEGRLLIVDKSLRSGQRVEHYGDILVLGDVNKDAEVVAVGNIVVMGALRGIAIAGALGDESAVVVALKMEPQQIRIGRKIAISDGEDRSSPGYPEVARVEDGKIILESV